MLLLNLLPVCCTSTLTATRLTLVIFFFIGIIGVISNPMRGMWLSLSRTSHKVAIEPLRAVRLSQGKQDAESANAEERQRVLNVFKLASRKDIAKARRKTMEERAQNVLTNGGVGTLIIDEKEEKDNDVLDIPPSFSPPQSPTSANQEEVTLPTAMEVDEEETRFQKDLETAIEASTQESQGEIGTPHAEGENERFERETKMAMELSLKEEGEFERGSMQVAEWTESKVGALQSPRS